MIMQRAESADAIKERNAEHGISCGAGIVAEILE